VSWYFLNDGSSSVMIHFLEFSLKLLQVLFFQDGLEKALMEVNLFHEEVLLLSELRGFRLPLLLDHLLLEDIRNYLVGQADYWRRRVVLVSYSIEHELVFGELLDVLGLLDAQKVPLLLLLRRLHVVVLLELAQEFMVPAPLEQDIQLGDRLLDVEFWLNNRHLFLLGFCGRHAHLRVVIPQGGVRVLIPF